MGLVLKSLYNPWSNCIHCILQPWSRPTSNGGQEINLGLIVPHSTFNERKYDKAISKSLMDMQKLKRKGLRNFHNVFNFAHAQVHRIMMKVNPSPTGKFKTGVLLPPSQSSVIERLAVRSLSQFFLQCNVW